MKRIKPHNLLLYYRSFSTLFIVFVLSTCFASPNPEWVSSLFIKNVPLISIFFIDGTREDDNGFGLIMAEVNDTLFIATAAHVISPCEGKQVLSITVRIKDFDQIFPASIAFKDTSLDIAVLKVPKPKGFIWEFLYESTPPLQNSKIWLIGSDGKWRPTASYAKGTVDSLDTMEIRASFFGGRRGVSGGPLMWKHGAAGIITNDDSNTEHIFAVPITVVQGIIRQVSQVHNRSRKKSFPRLSAGIFAGLTGPLSRSDLSNSKRNQIQYGGFKVDLFSIGISIEELLTEQTGLRLCLSASGVKSNGISVNQQQIVFRNRFTKIDLIGLRYFNSQKYVTSPTVGGDSYGGIGALLWHINPQIQTNSGAWQPIFGNQNQAISPWVFGGNFIYGLGLQLNSIKLQFELSLKFTNSEYLTINVDQLGNTEENNDFAIELNFILSFRIPSPNAFTRMLQ